MSTRKQDNKTENNVIDSPKKPARRKAFQVFRVQSEVRQGIDIVHNDGGAFLPVKMRYRIPDRAKPNEIEVLVDGKERWKKTKLVEQNAHEIDGQNEVGEDDLVLMSMFVDEMNRTARSILHNIQSIRGSIQHMIHISEVTR